MRLGIVLAFAAGSIFGFQLGLSCAARSCGRAHFDGARRARDARPDCRTGLLNIGLPKPGETVAVAAAAGPVGSAVGQIAKIKGCRVVGIAGGQKKVDYLKNELGFDAAVDHRSPRLKEELKAACPGGIDIDFENVGGAVWDAVLPLLNNFARVPAMWPGSELQRHFVARRPRPVGIVDERRSH